MKAMHTPAVTSDDLTISELLKDFYVVPSYQREYFWTEDNVQQLLEDIVREFPEKATAAASEYFLGSLVVCAQGRRANVYELIDGQQRMTTCYLAISPLRDRLAQIDPARPMKALADQIASTTTDPETRTSYKSI